ncbi:hypothetical protein [Anaeromyxobacter sp. SG26]|nr:hypothetical protein [Anaeromyxobacter sp. SG26]
MADSGIDEVGARALSGDPMKAAKAASQADVSSWAWNRLGSAQA